MPIRHVAHVNVAEVCRRREAELAAPHHVEDAGGGGVAVETGADNRRRVHHHQVEAALFGEGPRAALGNGLGQRVGVLRAVVPDRLGEGDAAAPLAHRRCRGGEHHPPHACRVGRAQRVKPADDRRVDDFALRVAGPRAIDRGDLEQSVAALERGVQRRGLHELGAYHIDVQRGEVRRPGGVVGIAHAGADAVAALGQQPRQHVAHVAIGAGDEDGLSH